MKKNTFEQATQQLAKRLGINMTDEQIKQRVAQILNILHDPKIGFNGLFNDVIEEHLAELRKKIDRIKEPERYAAERDKLLAKLRPTLE